MPRIKNYSRQRMKEKKTGNAQKPYVWKYTGTARQPFMVRVAKRKTEPTPYVVETFNFNDRDAVSMFKTGFTNKEAAREAAVDWMKDNPRP